MKNILWTLVAIVGLTVMACKSQKRLTNNSTHNSKNKAVREYKQPEWAKNAVIYEVNVRQFSPEGKLVNVTKEIPRLKKMGVDILWLMPIYPIGELNRKGSLGSYYAVKDYKAVNPNFGTFQDLKQLVNVAHENGMKVILDWVANHSSPDNVWIKDNLDFYSKDSLGNAPIPTIGTDWVDVADLNYDNKKMRMAMEDAMLYWVREADIDGYRCDVAEMVPMDFWLNVRPKLDQVKPVFMLAEGADPELFEAFNMIYGWPFKDLILEIAKGEKTFSDVGKYRDNLKTQASPDDLIMYFTTNHDENSWNYIEKDVFGENQENFAALTIAMGGMPLIYNGQESGLNKKLEFFEKDPIDWGTYSYQDFYTKLFKVYKENPALWSEKKFQKIKPVKVDQSNYMVVIEKNGKKLAFIQNYGTQKVMIKKIEFGNFDWNNEKLQSFSFEETDNELQINAHSTLIFSE